MESSRAHCGGSCGGRSGHHCNIFGAAGTQNLANRVYASLNATSGRYNGVFALDGCLQKSLNSRTAFADTEAFRTRERLKSFRVLKSSTFWTLGPQPGSDSRDDCVIIDFREFREI